MPNGSLEISDWVLQAENIYREIFWNFLVPIVRCIGILGNFTCLLVYVINSRVLLKSSSSVYLFTLTSSDLLFCLYRMAAFIYCSVCPWGFKRASEWGCKITNYIELVFLMQEILIILILTTARFVAVRFPLYYSTYQTVRHAKIYMISVVLFSLVYFIYVLIISHLNELGECALADETSEITLAVVEDTIFLVLPCLLIVSLNVGTIATLKQRRTIWHHKRPRSQWTLTAVSIYFVICLMPTAVVTSVRLVVTLHQIEYWKRPLDILYEYAALLICLQSSTNFIVYSLINRPFRSAVCKLFRCDRAPETIWSQISMSIRRITVKYGTNSTNTLVPVQSTKFVNKY